MELKAGISPQVRPWLRPERKGARLKRRAKLTSTSAGQLRNMHPDAMPAQ
jgi:hypothetical protein